jgi:hypothetical protein
MKLRVFTILKSMGLRYVAFRFWYELMRKTGFMKLAYPIKQKKDPEMSIEQFIAQAPLFLPMQISNIPYSNNEREMLANDYRRIISGEYPFFSGQFITTGHHDWLINPQSGFKYNPKKHWAEIDDIDSSAGDIKFVWERARFCWAYTLLRADRIIGTDSARFLFESILSFIESTPDNCGPHWRCGQEISLRVLNWITIIFTFRQRLNTLLSDSEFESIIKSIRSQIRHVYRNRRFARIAVRNNHAISEALGLYVTGSMFPWFSESKKWKMDGKHTLETEGLYQIYPDGSYIQHSFNYQRIVLQQYSFALSLARVLNDTFSPILKKRLEIMLNFMLSMQDNESGFLPNYGANDGALFFPAGRGVYRDFRPQMNALHVALQGKHVYNAGYWYDEAVWFCGQVTGELLYKNNELAGFEDGGYYTLRNKSTFVMSRCASFRNRPSQADQFHIDIWHKGKNIFRDCGSFTYVMSDPLFPYFSGTASHNTVQVSNCDQMERGPRFIWYNWPVKVSGKLNINGEMLCFTGEVRVYHHLLPDGVLHKRIIKLSRHEFLIEITDHLSPNYFEAVQIWNIDVIVNKEYTLTFFDAEGKAVTGNYRESYYSDTYGACESAKQLIIPLQSGYLRTIISLSNSQKVNI